MKRRLVVVAAVAGLVLPHALQAQEAAKPGPAWRISCHGISTIPMTADAMQALPMQVVATLNCGDQVSVLSDSEGYTVNVRTADGKMGYVAGMYIAKVLPPKPGPRVEPASAVVHNGVASWRRGTQRVVTSS